MHFCGFSLTCLLWKALALYFALLVLLRNKWKRASLQSNSGMNGFSQSGDLIWSQNSDKRWGPNILLLFFLPIISFCDPTPRLVCLLGWNFWELSKTLKTCFLKADMPESRRSFYGPGTDRPYVGMFLGFWRFIVRRFFYALKKYKAWHQHDI